MSVREFVESPWEQGADEARDYVLDTGPWGGSPATPVVKLYDDGYDDVSATKLTGAASVSGDNITTPVVAGLQAGRTYRLEIRFVVEGRTEEAYGQIVCAQ